ncbi:MAG: PIG-L family deacetylase [Oscillatoriales cyanobacterium RM1_1_9]|nr:PIG-L family deacetylase [Oscillatoriales cyanobacterium RM1_1_9]
MKIVWRRWGDRAVNGDRRFSFDTVAATLLQAYCQLLEPAAGSSTPDSQPVQRQVSSTSRPWVANPVRSLLRGLIYQTTQPYHPENWGNSALVFAPHPDDETLGCGGTIIQKKRAGADLKLVFMTDGSQSHAQFVAPERLKSIRTQEAISAAHILGLSLSDLMFLEIRDGTLAQRQPDAVAAVTEILQGQNPQEVFIPYRRDGIPDHDATYQVVSEALHQLGRAVTVYEYPVWFWNHWPWAGSDGAWIDSEQNFFQTLLDLRTSLKTSLKASLRADLALLKTFNCSVQITDVLEQKRLALWQHQSQMTRLIPHAQWLTLKDVSGGEFLKCFLQPRELFYRYSTFSC